MGKEWKRSAVGYVVLPDPGVKASLSKTFEELPNAGFIKKAFPAVNYTFSAVN